MVDIASQLEKDLISVQTVALREQIKFLEKWHLKKDDFMYFSLRKYYEEKIIEYDVPCTSLLDLYKTYYMAAFEHFLNNGSEAREEFEYTEPSFMYALGTLMPMPEVPSDDGDAEVLPFC